MTGCLVIDILLFATGCLSIDIFVSDDILYFLSMGLMSVAFDGLVRGTPEGLATRVVFLSESRIDFTQKILKGERDDEGQG